MILITALIFGLLFLFPLRRVFASRWRDLVPLVVGLIAGLKILSLIPYRGYLVFKALILIFVIVTAVHIIRPMLEDLFPRRK